MADRGTPFNIQVNELLVGAEYDQLDQDFLERAESEDSFDADYTIFKTLRDQEQKVKDEQEAVEIEKEEEYTRRQDELFKLLHPKK